MVLTDAQAYAIKVYYDSDSDVAKKAAEIDDDGTITRILY